MYKKHKMVNSPNDSNQKSAKSGRFSDLQTKSADHSDTIKQIKFKGESWEEADRRKRIEIARQCLDFQYIKCKNKQCINESCPLNKKYD